MRRRIWCTYSRICHCSDSIAPVANMKCLLSVARPAIISGTSRQIHSKAALKENKKTKHFFSNFGRASLVLFFESMEIKRCRTRALTTKTADKRDAALNIQHVLAFLRGRPMHQTQIKGNRSHISGLLIIIIIFIIIIIIINFSKGVWFCRSFLGLVSYKFLYSD